MAEQLTWDVLLTDATRYPDSMLWTLEDGSQIALGTLRQTVRGAFVPASDVDNYRRQSDAQVREARAAEQYAQQQLITLLSQSQAPADPVPADPYQNDPMFRPMYDRVKAVEAENTSLKSMLTDMQNLQKQMFGTIQQIPVVMSVQKIQARDPGVDGQKLLQFAQEHQIQPHRLDDAYTLMTHEQAVAKAREAGIAAGVEQAKTELALQPPQVPYAPFGMQQMQPPGQPKFEN